MRTIFTTLLFLGIFFTAAVAQTDTNGQPKLNEDGTTTLVVHTQIHCDHCDRCGSCKPRIENGVKIKKGIKSVTLDSEAQTITVVYKPKKTDPVMIRQAIAATGFDADDVKATKAGYDALDGCCKKH